MEVCIELREVAHVGPAPGVDGLIRVAHDEQVAVMARERLHERVLQAVDILELVHHDVLHALLPGAAHLRAGVEQVQRQDDEIVVVEPEALLLLQQVAVEDNVVDGLGLGIAALQLVVAHGDEVVEVVGAVAGLQHLYLVAGLGVGALAQGEPALLIDDSEHGVDVAVIEHREALRQLQGVTVGLQHRHAQAVEGVDESRVRIADEAPDAAAHLAGRLVGESGTQDVARQDAQHVR